MLEEGGGQGQYDQMARLFLQYLAICNNENLPNSKNIAKVGSKLCKNTKFSLKIFKAFLIFAKVAKFCQIWSHWSRGFGGL